jgi:hypothetical protein
MHTFGGTVDNRLHALDIGLPGTVGAAVRVGNLDPKRHFLAAVITLSHGDTSFVAGTINIT